MNKITHAPHDLAVATCNTIDIRFAVVGFENALCSVGVPDQMAKACRLLCIAGFAREGHT